MAAGYTGPGMGRPMRLDYADADTVQLNARVAPEIKRAMAESATRSDRTLGEEVRLAFAAWLDRGEEPAVMAVGKH